jgi:hypothetical protein
MSTPSDTPERSFIANRRANRRSRSIDPTAGVETLFGARRSTAIQRLRPRKVVRSLKRRPPQHAFGSATSPRSSEPRIERVVLRRRAGLECAARPPSRRRSGRAQRARARAVPVDSSHRLPPRRLWGAITPSPPRRLALSLDNEHGARRAEAGASSLGRDRRVAGTACSARGRESAAAPAVHHPAAAPRGVRV